MTSCHLYSETRIYCEFRENKSQVANWSKAKPFQMASLRSFWNVVTKIYDFLLRFRIIISKNPASQDKICLNDKFWSGTVLDFPDENNNLYFIVFI